MNRKLLYPIVVGTLVLSVVLSACNVIKQATPINLSLNENALGYSKNIKASINNELKNLSKYAGNDGDDLLKVIAKHEGVTAEQIISGEILDLLGVYLALKGGQGSEFIYSVPGYPALVNAAERVGGKIIAVPLNNNLENDLDAIEKNVNEKTQAIFLINPHNPSGTIFDSQVFHTFLKRVSKRTLIIVDEAYLEYADNFEERSAVKNIVDGENVIVFRTFAKAYGLAGLGFGFAIAPFNVAKYLKAQGLGDSNALNRISIVAAKTALQDKEALAKTNRLVSQERQKWHTFLDSIGLKHTDSKANFVFFDAGKSQSEVKQRLESNGIKVARSFPPYDTWIRISIGLPSQNIRVQNIIQNTVFQ